MARVLVIEDDPATAAEIAAELALHGHIAERVHDGIEGLTRAQGGGFDVITLDRMLPGLDGLSLVRALRDGGVDTPVLMLSALSDVDERIAGLRAGGDDYLTKPFAPDEMAVRVEALLRRRPSAEPAPGASRLTAGRLSVDTVSRRAVIDGVEATLLPMELKLLDFLIRNEGQVVSRRLIFEQVWEYYFDPGANLINVHVARLRKKLDRAGQPTLIQTVKGSGYRFDAPR
ncbi:MAG: response regulator transcription factor [Caulobacteraceae bacterium]|nr:response regulator transcription factor [Caulobacter sp.]